MEEKLRKVSKQKKTQSAITIPFFFTLIPFLKHDILTVISSCARHSNKFQYKSHQEGQKFPSVPHPGSWNSPAQLSTAPAYWLLNLLNSWQLCWMICTSMLFPKLPTRENSVSLPVVSSSVATLNSSEELSYKYLKLLLHLLLHYVLVLPFLDLK